MVRDDELKMWTEGRKRCCVFIPGALGEPWQVINRKRTPSSLDTRKIYPGVVEG